MDTTPAGGAIAHHDHDQPRGGNGDDHADHSTHAGHDPEMFRRKFWLSLALTVPVVFWADMVQDWFGYTAPEFPGSNWIAPVLGTVDLRLRRVRRSCRAPIGRSVRASRG